MPFTFPHLCQDGHEPIGFQGDAEECPVCRVLSICAGCDDLADQLDADGEDVQLSHASGLRQASKSVRSALIRPND